jgi:hypothetical protein
VCYLPVAIDWEAAIMPSDDDFKRQEQEFLVLARRIFNAGVRTERERVVAFLQGKGGFVVRAEVAHPQSAKTTQYGSVSAPVRDALIELGSNSPDGVGAADLADYFERRGGGPTEKQVRAALKLLTNTGEANRVSRGKYLPRAMATPSMSEEKPGGDAPDSFDVAAE